MNNALVLKHQWCRNAFYFSSFEYKIGFWVQEFFFFFWNSLCSMGTVDQWSRRWILVFYFKFCFNSQVFIIACFSHLAMTGSDVFLKVGLFFPFGINLQYNFFWWEGWKGMCVLCMSVYVCLSFVLFWGKQKSRLSFDLSLYSSDISN